MSCMLATEQNRELSSANSLAKLSNCSAITFTNIKNNNGPMTDPCGTLASTRVKVDMHNCIITLCFLFDQIICNQNLRNCQTESLFFLMLLMFKCKRYKEYSFPGPGLLSISPAYISKRHITNEKIKLSKLDLS